MKSCTETEFVWLFNQFNSINLIRFTDEEESLFTLAGEYKDRKLAIYESTRTSPNRVNNAR
jgi:hypothetical protein